MMRQREDEVVTDTEDVSRYYLQALTRLIYRSKEPNLGNNLQEHYKWNWDEQGLLLLDAFHRGGASFQMLTSLVENQISLISQNPKIIENISEPCRYITGILREDVRAYRARDRYPPQQISLAVQRLNRAHTFFKTVAAALELIIEKHVTFLSPESAIGLVTNLFWMFGYALVVDNETTREAVEKVRRHSAQFLPSQFPKIVSAEWKLGILQKLIMSTQMQLRVAGTSTMCSDLLTLYNDYKIPNGADNSTVLSYFATIVAESRVVEYIVGTGSHPEIINESHNIVGFLMATKQYPDSLAQTMWQAMTTSQDPRFVEALHRLFSQNIHLCDRPINLKLCNRLNSLPVSCFVSGTMQEVCNTLFNNLQSIQPRNFTNLMGQLVEHPPYELCVRLIRESSIITPESPNGYPEVQNFASVALRNLLKYGPDAQGRNSMYLDCIRDLADRKPTAPGSMCVIHLLTAQYPTDIHSLASEHGLTKLLIQQLESTVAEGTTLSSRKSFPSQARRFLLLSIIVNEPDSITQELGVQLWNLLVGQESGSAADRETSWQMLNSAVKRSSPDNQFLVTCYRVHFPVLPPDCFTTGALEFVREAVVSWLQEAHSNSTEEVSFDCPPLEQLWRMILTAPSNTIDAAAIRVLVEAYLDSALILSLPRLKARTIHSALVDRCLRQLAAAARKLKSFSNDSDSGTDEEGMVIVASESEFQEQETIFARSLAVLREFLQAYQLKKQFATPKLRSSLINAHSGVEGEPVVVRYQSFDGDQSTDIQTLTLGKDNSAASLFASLQKATGFKNYKVYCGGKQVDLEEIEVCKSFKELNINGLVLVQRLEEPDSSTEANSTSIDMEIMNHVADLWGYLGMHETVAKEIMQFLVKFPVYSQLLQDIKDDSVSHTVIFPHGKPYKSLYAIHAIREHIATEYQKGGVNDNMLSRAISLVVSATLDVGVLDNSNMGTSTILCESIIDCLSHLLKEHSVPTAALAYLSGDLLGRLLQLLYAAMTPSTPESAQLTCRTFDAILEASSHNIELWSQFQEHMRTNLLLQDLLLADPRHHIRKSVVKSIITKSAYSSSLARVSATQFAVAFWPLLCTIICVVEQYPTQCDELFHLSENLLRKLADVSINALELDKLLKSWGSLLVSHSSSQEVGRLDNIDLVARGLSTLCNCAASFAKASQQHLTCRKLGYKLFKKHLFPEMTTGLGSGEDSPEPVIPLLDSVTRHKISETIFYLVKDDRIEYQRILTGLHDLLPYDLTVDSGPYLYELGFQFERHKAIRSQTGYVGLRNLSNTCYLNSLFTQLFMNIPFREFMLNARLVDRGSQKLLEHTKTLFSYMQNSLERFVSPADLANSIRTYENTNIDVSIQMDVDEFYNLLFDRWESQMLASEDKKRFRTFYGGQLVQQVKSKECPHISERLEPFLAIQCDIKGKNCLQESLQAYVDGEIMEGDNKYKCSTCDRHVDAVKRACLKDIPDSLIFHLKRFDFNLRTLQRSKVNDYFSFPEKIDMRPYTVEHLMDVPDTPEDEFELVGVLVHAGTAESGHYYSYIRERPSSNKASDPWAEFNDDCVSPWDHAQMEASCFGGIDLRGPVDTGGMQYEKNYSAYMLFYQRKATLVAQKEALMDSGTMSPIRVPLDPQMANHLASENELLMRKYSLYDPSHATFVNKMLANIKQVNKGQCSEDHELEKLAIHSSLDFLDQVITRTKDLPDFQNFMVTINHICQTCAECSRDFLEWFGERPDVLRVLLLKNPDMVVRSEIGTCILQSLSKIKADQPDSFGYSEDDDSSDGIDNQHNFFQAVVETLDRLWEHFHASTRAWPEYFGLLSAIANMGDFESTILLEAGYLRRCLEVVTADNLLPMAPQYQRMLNNVSKRANATRPVSYDAVIALLDRLLQVVDLSLPAVNDHVERFDGQPIPLKLSEKPLIVQHWTRNNANILTQKLLLHPQNYTASRNILIMLLHCPENLDGPIFNAIRDGVDVGGQCNAHLRAAITYCEHSEDPNGIVNMIAHVANAADSENPDAHLFLRFFTEIAELSSNRNDVPKEQILTWVVLHAPRWAPALLSNYDVGVRKGTENYLTSILQEHSHQESLDADLQDFLPTNVVRQKLGHACLDYLSHVYVLSRNQAVRATLENIERFIEASPQYFDEGSKEKIAFLEKRQSKSSP